jgi:hypothetical protein
VRVLKGSLAAAMALAGLMIWANRSFWIDAYSGEREPVDLTIGSLDLSFRADAAGPSPFQVEEVPNTRSVELQVLGSTQTPDEQVTVKGGGAKLAGIITGPSGPLEGAEVVVQRFTNAGAGVVRTQTNSEGRWQVSGVHGGRFRVRAFVPGRYASAGSEVFFLSDGQTKRHNVNLAKPDEESIVRGIVIGNAHVGGTGSTMVFVANREIDDDGKTRQVAASGVEVSLVVRGAAVILTSPESITTGLTGFARFAFDCPGESTGDAQAIVAGKSYPVRITPCIDPGVPTDG